MPRPERIRPGAAMVGGPTALVLDAIAEAVFADYEHRGA